MNAHKSPLAMSDESEYNSFYFDEVDDLLTESFFSETASEFMAATIERIQELNDLLAFTSWSRGERRELQRELNEAMHAYHELKILSVV